MLILALILQGSGFDERLLALENWIEGWGIPVSVVFVVTYVAATVAAVPESMLTIAAGVLFGPLPAILYVSIGSTLGAALAFTISRHFLRGSVSRWLDGSPTWNRLGKLTEEHGAFMAAVTRLIPIFPCNVLNYAFGLTRISLSAYVFWSWLCTLPWIVVYILATDAVKGGFRHGHVPWVVLAVLAIVLTALGFLVRHARNGLRDRGYGGDAAEVTDDARTA